MDRHDNRGGVSIADRRLSHPFTRTNNSDEAAEAAMATLAIMEDTTSTKISNTNRISSSRTTRTRASPRSWNSPSESPF